MEITRKLPQKILMFILITSGIMILLSSVEALLKAKDTELFYMVSNRLKENGTGEIAYSDYVFSLLSVYFMKIIPPIGYSITSYLSFRIFRFGKSFMAVWGIVLLGSLVLHILTLEINNIFYYIIGIGYVLLFISIFLLKSDFDKQTNTTE